MKQENYIKLSAWVRKFKNGEKIVQYGNIFLTRIVYIAFLALLLLLAVHKDTRIVRIVLTTGISFIIVSVFRYILNTPRPYTKYEFDPIVKKKKVGQSMPSRHVFSVFVIGMAFLYINTILGIVIFAIGVLMCIGRVFAGVHFPSDVLVGALIGILSGVIGFYLI